MMHSNTATCGRGSACRVVFKLTSVLVVSVISVKVGAAIQETVPECRVSVVTSSRTGSPKGLGLPIYPGASVIKSEAVTPFSLFGVPNGGSGFAILTVKLVSTDNLEKLATFYRKSLAVYGQVITCDDSSSSTKPDAQSELNCAADHQEPGDLEFKVGTKEEQHAVGLRRTNRGTEATLAFILNCPSRHK